MNASKAGVATRILGKGPEYLRKQIDREAESPGRPSAAERLAASKPQYVKSPQLIAPKKDAVPPLTFSSASVSSNGSSNRSSGPSADKLRTPARQGSDRSSDRAGVVSRSGSKKQRPDSLLVHRRRRENAKGTLVRRLLVVGSPKDKTSAPPAVPVKECDPGRLRKPVQGEKPDPGIRTRLPDKHAEAGDPERKPRSRVLRSHSDISSRYSKNFSEFESFFKYCGLDGDVIESLGKENFSVPSDEEGVPIRSVSESSEDDSFSQESDENDGLVEEELAEKSRQNTSIIERNARIIKWLYSCKNAKESGKVLRDLE